MISLRNVTKSFKVGSEWRTVIREVSLDLPRGRNIGILGRNGAGKSTLLGMIGGSSLPDSGEILRHAEVSWPLGFKGAFHNALTGRQNTRFVARIYGVDTEDMMERVQDFAEIGDFFDMPVSTYSSGMKARLAFGVSMSVHFDLYLVDEITAVGDAAFKRKCAEAFREKAETSNILMVSHSTPTIREYCDAGIVLENGRLTYYDDLDDALEAHDRNMGEPTSKRGGRA